MTGTPWSVTLCNDDETASKLYVERFSEVTSSSFDVKVCLASVSVVMGPGWCSSYWVTRLSSCSVAHSNSFATVSRVKVLLFLEISFDKDVVAMSNST